MMKIDDQPWIFHEQLRAASGEITTTTRILIPRALMLGLLSAFGPLTYDQVRAVRWQLVAFYMFRIVDDWWCAENAIDGIRQGMDRALGISLVVLDQSRLVKKIDCISGSQLVDISDLGKQWLQLMMRPGLDIKFPLVSTLPRGTELDAITGGGEYIDIGSEVDS